MKSKTVIEINLPERICTNDAILLVAEKLVNARSKNVQVKPASENIINLMRLVCSIFRAVPSPSLPGCVGIKLSSDSLPLLKNSNTHLRQWLCIQGQRVN